MLTLFLNCADTQISPYSGLSSWNSSDEIGASYSLDDQALSSQLGKKMTVYLTFYGEKILQKKERLKS